jgi:hypothetical protein
MPTPRMTNGIRVCCHPERRAARRRTIKAQAEAHLKMGPRPRSADCNQHHALLLNISCSNKVFK